MPMTKRSFTIEFNGTTFSRLVSKTPRQAAQKAVLRMAKKHEQGGLPTGYKKDDWNTFKLIETTRGSHKRTFQYRGIRKTLDKPIEAQIAGKIILCKYDTEVYANKKTDTKSYESSDTNDINDINGINGITADTKVIAVAPKRTKAKKSNIKQSSA
jgi:hypothetical protein